MADRTLAELREQRDKTLGKWAVLEAHRQEFGHLGESGHRLIAKFRERVAALEAEIESRDARAVGLRLRERAMRADG